MNFITTSDITETTLFAFCELATITMSLLNLYRNELRLFNNFFRPVMKIAAKKKINDSVCRKKYDLAKTPYQRLVASKQITKQQRQELTEPYMALHPVTLKKEIDQKIKKIRQMENQTKLTN